MVPGKKVQLGQGHNCRVFTYVRGHINLLKMSAFCRFKLLVLSLLWQLDYYRSRKGAIIFVKTDGVCCQLFVQSQAYGERISDCVCTSTLNPILGLFKQQAKVEVSGEGKKIDSIRCQLYYIATALAAQWFTFSLILNVGLQT